MTFPRHPSPPTLQDIEAELGAIVFSLARVLPPNVGAVFIEGLQTSARALSDSGQANAGTFLEGLAKALPAVMPKVTKPH
jgi:hypothetical protein